MHLQVWQNNKLNGKRFYNTRNLYESLTRNGGITLNISQYLVVMGKIIVVTFPNTIVGTPLVYHPSDSHVVYQ